MHDLCVKFYRLTYLHLTSLFKFVGIITPTISCHPGIILVIIPMHLVTEIGEGGCLDVQSSYIREIHLDSGLFTN